MNSRFCLILGALVFASLLSMVLTGATNTSALEATQPRFSANSPIAEIAWDPQAKEILDGVFPTLTEHAAFDQFKSMSLRQLQPYSDGAITDVRIAEVDEALKAISSDEQRRLAKPEQTDADYSSCPRLVLGAAGCVV